MMYADTPARREARENLRESLANSVVPKSLRDTALRLCKDIPEVERRTHALAFVLFRGRTRDQLEQFIKRMEASA